MPSCSPFAVNLGRSCPIHHSVIQPDQFRCDYARAEATEAERDALRWELAREKAAHAITRVILAAAVEPLKMLPMENRALRDAVERVWEVHAPTRGFGRASPAWTAGSNHPSGNPATATTAPTWRWEAGMSDNKTVILPALVAIGCAQRLMEVSSVAIVAWLVLGYFNAWVAWNNGGLGAALVGFGASVVCLVLAWGHWRTRQEAKRLRDMLAKQAGLL